MKKFFEQPELTVEKFSVMDVITTSGGGNQGGGDVGELPDDEF